MTECTIPYPTGVPCWTDVRAPDVEAASAFYRTVFGWETEPAPRAAGHYLTCTLRGLPVAGIAGWEAGHPVSAATWTTHFAAEDADTVAARVRAAGGTVTASPSDVPPALGRALSANDPTGAAFGVWQAGDHIGARVVNEPGALVWSELYTTDGERARAFYGSVFGWVHEVLPDPDFDYTAFSVAGRERGGIAARPDGPPPRWTAYFAVADADEAIDRVRGGGGAVLRDPEDSPYGRLALVEDPFGAAFSVIALTGRGS